MVTSNTLVGTSAIPSSRQPFTKRKASKPKQGIWSQESLPHRIKPQQVGRRRSRKESYGQDAGGGEEKKHLDEILSGFVDSTGPSTKPDSSGGFAGLTGWEECALQCAVIVRSPVCAARCAHRKTARVAPPRRASARYDALRWRQARADALTLDSSP
ncbi:hypothetical protein JCM14124_18450 [Humidesulfovibrio idahonensis]